MFNPTLGEFLLCLCVGPEGVVVNVGVAILLRIDLLDMVWPIHHLSQKLEVLGHSIYLPKNSN